MSARRNADVVGANSSPEPLNKNYEETWRLLQTTAFELEGRAESNLKKCAGGLTLNEYSVLQILNAEAHGTLTLFTVLESVRLSRSAASRLVEKMEKAGLVKKQPELKDKRAVRVGITTSGRTAMKVAKPVYEQIIKEQFAQLNAKQISDLAALLEAVLGKNRN